MSEQPDFNKYLAIKQFTRYDDFNDFKDPNTFVREGNDWGWEQTYYLYPKDALVK